MVRDPFAQTWEMVIDLLQVRVLLRRGVPRAIYF